MSELRPPQPPLKDYLLLYGNCLSEKRNLLIVGGVAVVTSFLGGYFVGSCPEEDDGASLPQAEAAISNEQELGLEEDEQDASFDKLDFDDEEGESDPPDRLLTMEEMIEIADTDDIIRYNPIPRAACSAEIEPHPMVVEFVEEYLEDVLSAEKIFGVPREVALAQAILESGYGESDLSRDANNFFGIKVNPQWHGDEVRYTTWEEAASETEAYERWGDDVISVKQQDNGRYRVDVYARFQKYESAQDGFIEYGRYLYERGDSDNQGNWVSGQVGNFFGDALWESTDPYDFASRLVDDYPELIGPSGETYIPRYATDSEYANKLHGLIDQVCAVGVGDDSPLLQR